MKQIELQNYLKETISSQWLLASCRGYSTALEELNIQAVDLSADECQHQITGATFVHPLPQILLVSKNRACTYSTVIINQYSNNSRCRVV